MGDAGADRPPPARLGLLHLGREVRIDQQVRQDAVREILDQAARIKIWPKVDFFNEFP